MGIVDPEPPHGHVVRVNQPFRGRIDDGLHGPPRHPMPDGDLRHDPPGTDHRSEQQLPQPGRQPRAGRDLIGHLDERPPTTRRLGAGEPPAHQHDVHRARDGDVSQSLSDALMDPAREDAAAGAGGLRHGRRDQHLPGAVGMVDSVQDMVSGQVEQHARCVSQRARSLVHGSWSSSGWCLSSTHPSAGPRAPHHRAITLKCEEPLEKCPA